MSRRSFEFFGPVSPRSPIFKYANIPDIEQKPVLQSPYEFQPLWKFEVVT
jgi:hypothetical protein